MSATQTRTHRLNYIGAILEAQREEMRRDERVIIFGEDIRSNMWGTTTGFVEEFGLGRVRDTPISELAFCGAAIGAAMTGMRPIVDLQIATFFYTAMDSIVSQAAKSHYMFGGQCTLPVVFRGAMFYGASIAAHHSDRPYATFMTVPGLKVIVPSGPYEVKGLLKSAIRDDDPVLCFEDNNVWMAREEIPEEEYLIPLGRAHVKREGRDATVVAIAGAVPLAMRAAEQLEGDGISVEVVDPRTLVPMDWTTILASVQKTGRLIVADPAVRTCSVASEIAATASEELFTELRSAPRRVVTPDIQIPFSPALERGLYPDVDKITAAVRSTLA